MKIKLTITLFNDSAISKPDLVWLPVNLILNSFSFLVHQKNYLSPLTHRVEIQNQARISKLHCTLTISLEQLDLRVQRDIAVSKSKPCKKKKKMNLCFEDSYWKYNFIKNDSLIFILRLKMKFHFWVWFVSKNETKPSCQK